MENFTHLRIAHVDCAIMRGRICYQLPSRKRLSKSLKYFFTFRCKYFTDITVSMYNTYSNSESLNTRYYPYNQGQNFMKTCLKDGGLPMVMLV